MPIPRRGKHLPRREYRTGLAWDPPLDAIIIPPSTRRPTLRGTGLLAARRPVLLHAQRRSRLGQRQHLVVELEAGGPRLMIADVPFIRLLQPYFERGQLHLEDAGHFADVLGDGREIVVDRKSTRLNSS